MASNASSSSTFESASSESPQNTLTNEKCLLDRMAKLRENKQKIFSTLCKVKNEMKDNEEFDKSLMTELRDNYGMLCAQEDEFLKVMQNNKLCQALILDKKDFGAILLYEFKKGSNASEAAKNVNHVLGEGSVSERQTQKWFQRFRSGDETLEDDEDQVRHTVLGDALTNRNAAKRSDLALLNVCISILEIRQLQGASLGLPGPSFINTASQALVPQHSNVPISDQLETIRKNKEKIQRTLKNLEDNAEIDEEIHGKMLAEITADYYMLSAQENECSKQSQKEKHNIEYLKRLREEKRRVILVLRSLRENLTEEDEVDKTLVAEMLAKYDMLSFQEEEFSRPLRILERSRHLRSEKPQPQGDVGTAKPNDAKEAK